MLLQLGHLQIQVQVQVLVKVRVLVSAQLGGEGLAAQERRYEGQDDGTANTLHTCEEKKKLSSCSQSRREAEEDETFGMNAYCLLVRDLLLVRGLLLVLVLDGAAFWPRTDSCSFEG